MAPLAAIRVKCGATADRGTPAGTPGTVYRMLAALAQQAVYRDCFRLDSGTGNGLRALRIVHQIRNDDPEDDRAYRGPESGYPHAAIPLPSGWRPDSAAGPPAAAVAFAAVAPPAAVPGTIFSRTARSMPNANATAAALAGWYSASMASKTNRADVASMSPGIGGRCRRMPRHTMMPSAMPQARIIPGTAGPHCSRIRTGGGGGTSSPALPPRPRQ